MRESPRFLLRCCCILGFYLMTVAMDNLGMKRKMQLAEFGELFAALFKIPDRGIQLRVLDAVNGIIKETCDCSCCKKDVAEKGTQTEFISKIENPVVMKREISTENSVVMKREISTENSVNGVSNGGREIKKRKRNRKVPCVEKSTSQPEPFLVKPVTSYNLMGETMDPHKLFDNVNFDEIGTISEPEHPVTTTEELLQQMRKEYKIAGVYNNKGLLPIHKAIKTSDIKSLKRQMWVLQFKEEDLNNVFTEAGETLVEYAIKVDTSEDILKELLDKNVSLDITDDEDNNILHLAMMKTTNKHHLINLLEKLDYLYLEVLNKKNNKGLTVLHLGVKENNFLLCKALLDFVDTKFNLSTVGKDEFDLRKLKDIYLAELNGFAKKKPAQLQKEKMKLINAVDVMQGRTPLFHAVSQNSQDSKLMVFMLLCHLADPSIKDLSGLDCLAYVETVEKINAQVQAALRNTAIYLEKFQ